MWGRLFKLVGSLAILECIRGTAFDEVERGASEEDAVESEDTQSIHEAVGLDADRWHPSQGARSRGARADMPVATNKAVDVQASGELDFDRSHLGRLAGKEDRSALVRSEARAAAAHASRHREASESEDPDESLAVVEGEQAPGYAPSSYPRQAPGSPYRQPVQSAAPPNYQRQAPAGYPQRAPASYPRQAPASYPQRAPASYPGGYPSNARQPYSGGRGQSPGGRTPVQAAPLPPSGQRPVQSIFDPATTSPPPWLDSYGRCEIPLWGRNDFACKEHKQVAPVDEWLDSAGIARKKMTNEGTCTVRCPGGKSWLTPDTDMMICKNGQFRNMVGTPVTKIDCVTSTWVYGMMVVLVFVTAIAAGCG